MGAANCLITNIFQNIFFCVKQKKETHTSIHHDNEHDNDSVHLSVV